MTRAAGGLIRSTPLVIVLWLCVIGIVFLGARLVMERQRVPAATLTAQDGQRALVLQRAHDGHFRIKGRIGGPAGDRDVVFLMDTGATTVTIDVSLASALSLPVGEKVTSITANGPVEGFETRIPQLQFGGYTLTQVRAIVVPNLGDEVLMGMNVISRFDVQLKQDEMHLALRAGQ
ncbi:retropepsin-like aspartic protease family protein [Andreprevotia chitinilytica]|uniref:retropepsin-like aspartic protease family protein n=1 Tax=Andreprevotia chitinilytica TaxID=396808 RepID=UPI00068C3D68|nr:retropepsin-like aspartic protease [Andreprevotia chitinilytica]